MSSEASSTESTAEVDASEHGSDTSGPKLGPRNTYPDVEGSKIHSGKPAKTFDLPEVVTPSPLPARSPSFDDIRAAFRASPLNLPSRDTAGSRYHKYQRKDIPAPLYANLPRHGSPYASYTPYGNASQPQSDLPYPFSHNTRTIEHRFAGFLFKIRTDAEEGSKKLVVKRVGNVIKYYCSGVLLTTIKYKLERDIFSLYEDADETPIQDTKLCEKIETLMGPIVAGLFEAPWQPEPFNSMSWGVRGCEGIGDGNFFHVDVVHAIDDRYMDGSRRTRSSHSFSPRSRPVVAYMDAFHHIPSVERVGEVSRGGHAQHAIDRTQLIKVIREVELRTAAELAKRSYLDESDAASIIGEKDDTLSAYHINRTFSAEVPTLYGLFVSKVSRWASRLQPQTKDGEEEKPLRLHERDSRESSMRLNSEIGSSAGSDLHTLPAPFPASSTQSTSHTEVDAGSEDEDDTSSDGQSQGSGVGPFFSESGSSNSQDDEEGSSDYESLSSVEDPFITEDNYNDEQSNDATASHTDSVRPDTFGSVSDSHKLSKRSVRSLIRHRLLPNFNTDFEHLTGTNYHDVGSSRKQVESVPPEIASPAELKRSENEDSKEGATSSSGDRVYALPWWAEPITRKEVLSAPRHGLPRTPENDEQSIDTETRDHKKTADSDTDMASSAEVSGNHTQQVFEPQERGTKGEGPEGDCDTCSDNEGHTDSQQNESSRHQDNASHYCSAQQTVVKSGHEFQSGEEEEKDTPDVESESSDKGGLDSDSLRKQYSREESKTSVGEEPKMRRNQRNEQIEEGESRAQDSNGQETYDEGTNSAPESSDIRDEPVSILRQPRKARHDIEKTWRKVTFNSSSSEHSTSDGESRSSKLEDERHKDEFNEGRRAHLRHVYSNNPLQYDFPPSSYLIDTHTPPNPYASSSQSSIVEPYKEAVAAGQIYDISPCNSEEASWRGSSSYRKYGNHRKNGSYGYHGSSTKTHLSHGSFSSDVDSLPTPATSRKHSHRFSRRNAHRYGYITSSVSTVYGSYHEGIPAHIAKDIFSVILGVVIVIFSILAIALDPAGEENWFKRLEEGAFVMFSLGIPVFLVMRSRFTENLQVLMPKLTREVRSIRDLQNMKKGMKREEFVKQLQRELLFDESISRLFSSEDACYKFSRISGNLVIPDRAEYKKLFKKVWFFGEELAYNRVLGRAFRYRQKNNILIIENESVDIEGVIVHVRRRKDTYFFGSTAEA